MMKVRSEAQRRYLKRTIAVTAVFAILWFFGLGVGAVANKLQYGTYGECW